VPEGTSPSAAVAAGASVPAGHVLVPGTQTLARNDHLEQRDRHRDIGLKVHSRILMLRCGYAESTHHGVA
jgi:hypothetical protein